MSTERTTKEEIKVTGEALISTVKDTLHQGNIRRITIKNDEGQTLIEVPLTIGVIGFLLIPVWAALGAIAALAANLTIVVEKIETEEKESDKPAAE